MVRGKAIIRRFLAKLFDVFIGRFGLQQRVIDQAGPIARRSGLAQDQPNARRARVDDPMHALGATMKALRRAAAHLRLIIRVTIQPRIDDVSNLLD